MKAILISMLFAIVRSAAHAGFTVDDWHQVGVNAPFSDVGVGYWEDGYKSLAIDNDENPIVAGGFTCLADQAVSAVEKWNGAKWQALGADLDFYAMNRHHATAVVSDGTNINVRVRVRLGSTRASACSMTRPRGMVGLHHQ